MQAGQTPGSPDQPAPAEPQPTMQAPPAAPPTPPPYVGPAATTPADGPPTDTPPKKKRTGLWIGLVAGIIVMFLLCACVAVSLGGFFGGAAKTRESYTAAEEHYAAAGAALDGIKDLPTKLESVDDPKMMSDQYVAEVEPAVAAAQTELDAAAAELESVDDSEAKRAYLASLKAADAALAELTAMSVQIQQIGALGSGLGDVGPKFEDANKSLDSAVSSAEDEDWGDARSACDKASDQYGEVEKALRALDKENPKLGFDSLIADVVLRKKAAAKLLEATQAGDAGSAGRYNSTIKDFNALAAKTGKADIPAFIDDPNVLLKEFWVSYKGVNEKLLAAEAAHSKAADAIEAGKY